ncbi:hypothetical protein V2J09_023202 [Rumex salicifolius]
MVLEMNLDFASFPDPLLLDSTFTCITGKTILQFGISLHTMLRDPAPLLLVFSLLVTSAFATQNMHPRCNCDDDISLWTIDSILECQRVSDFLISVAYFSIPIELLYFISCSNLPFKWVLCEFTAFIVLCGMTHFLNGLTYGPHSFHLYLALTVFKILTALVSCATAITLFTLIPLLLKVKVREFMLKQKARELNREVGIIRRQREAGWHVRMLTREIRKSLDRHTILYTTMVELSKTLDLQNCAVWMPNEEMTEMTLTHQLKGRAVCIRPVPCSNPDVRRVKETEQVIILSPDSAICVSSSGGFGAAIRMPMLRVSNFIGKTPRLMKACYGILVLVGRDQDRNWDAQELEIIQVVADQVAVAISHAAVLEESQLMRDKLADQNRALQTAQKEAMLASQARSSFQRVMSRGMRKPLHTVLGLLSVLQDQGLSSEQDLIIRTMSKTNNVVSVLVDDMMDDGSVKESGSFPSEVQTFRLHSLVAEAGCVARCLSVTKGYGFTIEVDRSLPDHVVGDERRVFQVILHMVGNLLECNRGGQGGSLRFRVFSQPGRELRGDQRWATWTSTLSDDGYVHIRFEVEIVSNGSLPTDGDSDPSASLFYSHRHYREAAEGDLSFRVCQDLVEVCWQLMQGNMWVFSNQQGCPQSKVLVLRFQLRPSIEIPIPDSLDSSTRSSTNPNAPFKGLNVLLADEDNTNRGVTRKLLEKLGCRVISVSSGYECLSALNPGGSHSPKVVIMDLHFRDLDGLEVVTRMRKLYSRNWPMVVALTADEDELTVYEKMKAVGVNGVIRKPVLLGGLVAELRRVLLQAK